MNINRIAILIKIASLEFEKISNPILAEYDLTAAQYRILKFLYSRQTETARVVDIEKQCSITHPTVLGLLDNLEKKGFVSRTANPEDARSKVVTLTEKTKLLQEELEGVGNKIDDILTANLTAFEKAQLKELLQKLLENRK